MKAKGKAGNNIRGISSKSRIRGFTSTLLKALGKKTEKGEPNKRSKSGKIKVVVLTAMAILTIFGFFSGFSNQIFWKGGVIP